ncbi:MAG: hypothetical protein IKQ49_07565 [Eubacterium sp.]|nr:hypothetical protein [Eubacterium sp.]
MPGGWYAKNAAYVIDGVNYAFDEEGYLTEYLWSAGKAALLIAPLWSADKKHVWNRIQKECCAFVAISMVP